MGLRLTLPYPPGEPGPEVGGALPASAGTVLDAGMTWSETGAGELVVTAVGLVACDVESMEMAGVPWPSFDAGNQLSDLGSYASIAMHVEGCGTLTFGIDHRLAANIWAIASQLSEAGDDVEIDGVVTSPGISALIEPEAPADPASTSAPSTTAQSTTAQSTTAPPAQPAPPAPPSPPTRAPILAGAPAESWWPAPNGGTALLGGHADATPLVEAPDDGDDLAVEAGADLDLGPDIDPGLGIDNDWTAWRVDGDEHDDPAGGSDRGALAAARLAGPRGRSLFDEGDTVRVPPSLATPGPPNLVPPPDPAAMPAPVPIPAPVDPSRYRVYTPVVEDEPPPSRRRPWLIGGSVGAVVLALVAAGMAFLPSGGDDTSAGSSTTTVSSLGSATAEDDQAAAAGAPDGPAITVATLGKGRCSPAYLPCLPDLEGDALDCGDLAPDQKPVRLLDRDNDPYQLQGPERSGVACAG